MTDSERKFTALQAAGSNRVVGYAHIPDDTAGPGPTIISLEQTVVNRPNWLLVLLDRQLVPDFCAIRLPQLEAVYNKGNGRHNDRVVEPCTDVTRRSAPGKRDEGQHPAEDAVADLVRQRE